MSKTGFAKGNTALMTRAYTGSLAEQLTNGSISTVFLCSRSSSNERVESAATAVQPNPAKSEKNALPFSPIFSNKPSDIKAKRAMTPLSSKTVRNKNRMMSCGKNPKTAKTPVNTPSHKKPANHGGTAESASRAPLTAFFPSAAKRSVRSIDGEYFPNAA